MSTVTGDSLPRFKPPVLVINIAACCRDAIPLGVYATLDPPRVSLGQEIVFTVFGSEVIARGMVKCIEQPGSTIRIDMKKFERWTKIHYVLFPP